MFRLPPGPASAAALLVLKRKGVLNSIRTGVGSYRAMAAGAHPWIDHPEGVIKKGVSVCFNSGRCGVGDQPEPGDVDVTPEELLIACLEDQMSHTAIKQNLAYARKAVERKLGKMKDVQGGAQHKEVLR